MGSEDPAPDWHDGATALGCPCGSYGALAGLLGMHAVSGAPPHAQNLVEYARLHELQLPLMLLGALDLSSLFDSLPLFG